MTHHGAVNDALYAVRRYCVVHSCVFLSSFEMAGTQPRSALATTVRFAAQYPPTRSRWQESEQHPGDEETFQQGMQDTRLDELARQAVRKNLHR